MVEFYKKIGLKKKGCLHLSKRLKFYKIMIKLLNANVLEHFKKLKMLHEGYIIGENINETSKSALCSTLMESYKRSRNAHCS